MQSFHIYEFSGRLGDPTSFGQIRRIRSKVTGLLVGNLVKPSPGLGIPSPIGPVVLPGNGLSVEGTAALVGAADKLAGLQWQPLKAALMPCRDLFELGGRKV